jgi:DNA helicase-2/ATP-dependent DNA helicase PcrA
MKERITRLVGSQAEEAWISTFHSTCARILRRDIEKLGYTRSFTIYDDDDQGNVIKEILKQMNLDEKLLPPRELKTKISDAKNRLMSPDDWFRESAKDYRCQLIHDAFQMYEERLRSSNALDFDDLIMLTVKLFQDNPDVLAYYQFRFRYILVDEYQDTNYSQYLLVKLLAGERRNLCVVGDEDQGIYSWRGADITNILNFERDYQDAKVIKLEQNYRSTQTILDAAYHVIKHNTQRKDKHLWTANNQGTPIVCFQADNEHDEAVLVPGTENQVFCCT